ncbi:MAG: phage capsid protein [Akkermansia sp.]
MANVYVGSVPVPEQSIIDYSNQWKEELQQLTSELAPFAVTVSGLVGDVEKFGRVSSTSLNETAAYDKTGTTPTERNRHQDLEIDELELTSMWMSPKEYDKALWFQYDDKQLFGGIDPAASAAVPMLRAAAQREVDKILLGVKIDKVAGSETYNQPIIDKTSDMYNHGIFGLTKTGEQLSTATGIALPEACDVSEDTGGATKGQATGLNLKKITAIRRILEEREVISKTSLGQTQAVMLVTSEMIAQLIEDEERLGSSEYGFSALRDGNVLEVCGIRFIKTNNLPFIKSGDVYVRRAVAYVPSQLRYGVWQAQVIEIKDQPSKKKSFTIATRIKISCARIDDNAFVTVDSLTDAATVVPEETDSNDSNG